MRAVDTNVLIRLAARDDIGQTEAAEAFDRGLSKLEGIQKL